MKQANRFNSISPGWNIALSILLSLVGLLCLAPMLLVIIISVTGTESLSINGYTFFPTSWTL